MLTGESLTLSAAEVEELTGTPRAKLQLAFLVQNGIPAMMDRSGRVKVLRAAVEAKLMPGRGASARQKTGPDLSILKKAS